MKSTLCSSGLFFPTEDNRYFFKEKEALNYIIKVTEKVLTKKLEKNIKDSKTSSTAKTSKNSKSASSVNNNFNSSLSISSISTNKYFGNKSNTLYKKLKKEEFSQNSTEPNIADNKPNPEYSFKKNGKDIPIRNYNKIKKKDLNSIKTGNQEKGIYIDNNIYEKDIGKNKDECLYKVPNYNKYNYVNENLNTNSDPNLSVKNFSTNHIDKKNIFPNDNNCNCPNTRNIKKR